MNFMKTWKEAISIYLAVLSEHSPGQTEENHDVKPSDIVSGCLSRTVLKATTT
jgi:hypothetical protein